MTGAGLPQSALVAVVPQTGAIRAMANGKWPFHTHKYNLATDPGGGRSAGSVWVHLFGSPSEQAFGTGWNLDSLSRRSSRVPSGRTMEACLRS